jgi:hypothetical protein|tara:strand:+ start:300 stop:512 length:213 start_codon:yes stop_codon:yes gene_type:complete
MGMAAGESDQAAIVAGHGEVIDARAPAQGPLLGGCSQGLTGFGDGDEADVGGGQGLGSGPIKGIPKSVLA